MRCCDPAPAWCSQFQCSGFWLCLLICLAFPAAKLAAQQANGAVRGTVQDADFFAPLAGVNIVLEGASSGATSDSDGNFFINNVPPGSYTLMAVRDGYVRERLSDVVISAGGVKEVSIEMTGEVVELDEFVVSDEAIAAETSAVEAITLRTELKSFTDVLGEQFISQTGASDAAKLLAKTTGVNVADGKFVVVRGLNDRYNVVTLNGLRVPSSDPDRRAVALDLFPTAVIRDVRTSKTFQPDLNAESTGGTIDIYTKAVPDEDFVKFKLGTGYNSQATGNNKYLTYNGGGTGMFGTAESRALPDFIRNDPLPLLTNVSAGGVPANSRIDHPIRLARQMVNDALSPVMGTSEEPAPMDLSLEASMGHRTEFLGAPAGVTVAFDYSKKYTYNVDRLGRYTFTPGFGTLADITRLSDVRNGQETMRAGLLVAAGIQPDARNEVVATYFFNRIAEDRATLQYGQLGQNFLPEERDYRESLAYTQRDLKVMQLAGRHDMDFDGRDLEVKWALSYNQSSQLEPDHRFVRGIYQDGPPNGAGTVGIYQPIPGNPTVPEFQRLWRELYDQSYSFRMDVITDLFEQEDVEAQIKFGSAFDYTNRNYRADGFAYNRGSQNNQFPSGAKPGFPDATWADVFLYGNLPVGQDLDGIPNNGALVNANTRLWIYRPNAFEFYDASQMLASSYAMLDFDLAPGLNVTFGVRLESTDVKVQSSPIWQYPEETLRFALLSATDRQGPDDTLRQLVNAAFTGDVAAQQDPRIVARSRAQIQEQHLLPALSVNWDIGDHSRLRAAVARTVARPSFKEIAPVVFQNVETGDFFAGNADLELSTIMNYDVRWEWFPSPGSLVGVSFFSKLIRNPIELEQSAAPTGPTLTRFINSPDAVVYGLELEFQRDLSFVGDELRWFSLGANYSYISSVARRAPYLDNLGNNVPSLFGETRRLQGQPDYIVNFNLTYDNPEQPLGAGVFLNIVGPQLFAVGGQPEDPDIFQEPVTTLDLSLSYRLSKRTKLTFRAQNLLNAATRRFFNNAERPLHSERKTGIGYSVSMTFDW